MPEWVDAYEGSGKNDKRALPSIYAVCSSPPRVASPNPPSAEFMCMLMNSGFRHPIGRSGPDPRPVEGSPTSEPSALECMLPRSSACRACLSVCAACRRQWPSRCLANVDSPRETLQAKSGSLHCGPSSGIKSRHQWLRVQGLRRELLLPHLENASRSVTESRSHCLRRPSFEKAWSRTLSQNETMWPSKPPSLPLPSASCHPLILLHKTNVLSHRLLQLLLVHDQGLHDHFLIALGTLDGGLAKHLRW